MSVIVNIMLHINLVYDPIMYNIVTMAVMLMSLCMCVCLFLVDSFQGAG